MTASAPDMWQERFLVSIQALDGSEVQFSSVTEDITTFPEVVKDVEGVSMANGGRRTKWTPEGDLELTFKVYDIDCKTDGNGFTQLIHPQTTADSTDPIKVLATHNRTKYQVILTWAEDIGVYTTAGQASTADKQARRFTCKNAYLTRFQETSDDKNISAEVTFKFQPFNRTGTANYKYESTATIAIPALTAYTTANQYSVF